MENNPKKSRALIITIIIIVMMLIVGYLLYKNGSNSSSSNFISRIFSSLSPSDNSKKVTVQAGEDIKKDDQVCATGTNTDGNSIVMKINSMVTGCNKVLGTASTDINNGKSGEIVLSSGNAFSDYINNLFNKNNGNNIITTPVYNNPTDNPNIIDNSPADLVVGSVNPQNTNVNENTTISSVVTNIGGTSTNNNFSALFTINRNGGQVDAKNDRQTNLSTVVPILEARVGSVATVSYTFKSTGTYYVRACADKNSASDMGVISESNENNNCSEWTKIEVASALPTGGDTCDNGANNPPLCTTIDGACINGATNPPDCTTIPTGTTPAVNKCLLIEQNPLTFTDEEKARLAVLLRKFYLISSTLRTEDDITTIYNEIDQQKNFINQIGSLTKQCYVQYDQVKANGGGTDWVRRGNPWYRVETGGVFPYGGNTSYMKPDSSEVENEYDVFAKKHPIILFFTIENLYPSYLRSNLLKEKILNIW